MTASYSLAGKRVFVAGHRGMVGSAIVRRLASGDLEEALKLALRRLVAYGIRSTVRFGLSDSALARRWGSALAFPISSRTALQLREQIHPQPKETNHDR